MSFVNAEGVKSHQILICPRKRGIAAQPTK